MSDYRNQTIRPMDMGINLVQASDALEAGRWISLHNVDPIQEAILPTRMGRRTFLDTEVGNPIHSLTRLSPKNLLVGIGTRLYRDDTEIDDGYSGNPLTFVSGQDGLIYVGDSEQIRIVDQAGAVFKWGITAPTQPAAFSAVGTGVLDSSVPGASVYDWRYTYYSAKTKTESNGSPVASGIAVVLQQGAVQVFPSSDPQVSQIRLYRRGGTLSDAWRLVMTLPNANQVVNDNNADEDIALFDQLSDINYPPFSSEDQLGNFLSEVPLPYVWGPFLGKVIFGTGDFNRPNTVYWTNFGSFGSADVTNFEAVTGTVEPLMNGWMFGSLPYVASKDAVYAIDFGNPSDPTFTVRRTPVGRGISGHWAFCVGPLVYILSKDGIYETDCQSPNVTSITEQTLRPIFQGHSIEGQGIPTTEALEPIVDDEILGPVDFTKDSKLRLTYANHEVHFFYEDTSGLPHHLIFHTLYRRWRSAGMGNGVAVKVAYFDVNSTTPQLLLGTNNGKVYVPDPSYMDDDGIPIQVKAKSGDLMNGFGQVSLHNLMVETVPSDPSGVAVDVSILPTKGQFEHWGRRFTVPGETQAGSSLGRPVKSRFTFADEPFGTSDVSSTPRSQFGLVLEWIGRATVRQLMLQFRTENENTLFWDSGETTHGLTGWQHVKDLYVTLRGNSADGTYGLTHFVDNVAHEYEFEAPASYQKQKIYIPLGPHKGKMFRYRITAPPDPSLTIHDGLTAAWLMNDSQGILVDSAGSNDFTETGNVPTVPGMIGEAAFFDGTVGNLLTAQDSSSLRLTLGWTMSLWVRVDDFPVANCSIISKLVNGSDLTTIEYQLRARTSGLVFQFIIGRGTNSGVDVQSLSLNTSLGGPGIEFGTWYHIMVSISPDRILKMYLNNVLQEQEAFNANPFVGTSTVQLGDVQAPSGSQLFEGAVDAVMIWQRELTAAERAFVYSAGTGREVFTGSFSGQDSGIESGFDINAGECEVRAKTWDSRLGYQLINPFQPGDTPGQEP